MGLIVALDDNNQAAGELFWDDGDSRGLCANVLVCLCEKGSTTSCYYHSLQALFYAHQIEALILLSTKHHMSQCECSNTVSSHTLTSEGQFVNSFDKH